MSATFWFHFVPLWSAFLQGIIAFCTQQPLVVIALLLAYLLREISHPHKHSHHTLASDGVVRFTSLAATFGIVSLLISGFGLPNLLLASLPWAFLLLSGTIGLWTRTATTPRPTWKILESQGIGATLALLTHAGQTTGVHLATAAQTVSWAAGITVALILVGVSVLRFEQVAHGQISRQASILQVLTNGGLIIGGLVGLLVSLMA